VIHLGNAETGLAPAQLLERGVEAGLTPV